MDISHRGRTIQASPIRKFKPYADDALKKGIKVYFLNIGDPDIPTPQPVFEAFRNFKDAILSAVSVGGNPGDEIIIPEPFYTNYNGYASIASIKIVPLSLRVEDGFRLPSRAEIEAKITPRTKAILLCSPNHPMGTVYTDEELRRVASIVRARGLFFIGDEVYKEFVYDGAVHKSILEFTDSEDRAIG